MQKKLRLLIICFLAISAPAFSQQRKTGSHKQSFVYAGLGFELGVPIHDFATYNDNAFPGGAFSLFYQPAGKVPLLIGADFGYLGMGYKTDNPTLHADIVANGTVIQSIDIPLRVETTNSAFTGRLDFRVLSPTKYFKPYIDAFAGFNSFSTSTSIYDESEENYLSDADNPLITRTNVNNSWTYTYGAAGGMLVELGKSFLIDVRLAYAMGGAANYYTRDDISDWTVEFSTVPTDPNDLNSDDISISAVPKRSVTDMIQGSIGIALRF